MEGDGILGKGVIGRPGQRENPDGAGGSFAAKGGNDRPDGSAGGQDVIHNHKRSGWGGIDDLGGINVQELGFAVCAGEIFVADGLSGLPEEGREVPASETERQGLAKVIE